MRAGAAVSEATEPAAAPAEQPLFANCARVAGPRTDRRPGVEVAGHARRERLVDLRHFVAELAVEVGALAVELAARLEPAHGGAADGDLRPVACIAADLDGRTARAGRPVPQFADAVGAEAVQ